MPVTNRTWSTSVKVSPSRDSVREEQVRALLLRGADDPVGAGGHGQRPAAEREEDGDPADCQEHDTRDQYVRPAGLLGVHGRLLEAEEGGDAEAERGADPGAGQGVRVEGVQRQALGAGIGDGGDVEHHHERDLDEQQDAQHARVRRRSSASPARRPRGPPAARGSTRPRRGRGRWTAGRRPRSRGCRRCRPGGRCRHQRHQAAPCARGAAESAGDAGVEGARVVDVPAHLGVPDAEQDQHHAQQHEEQRLSDDAHDREGGGHDAARPPSAGRWRRARTAAARPCRAGRRAGRAPRP